MNCTIQGWKKGRARIYILHESLPKLIHIIKPYMLPSMLYNPQLKKKKYTIYQADVIHSFAVPSLGLKIDACPGRLNQASIICERTGTFYGLNKIKNFFIFL